VEGEPSQKNRRAVSIIERAPIKTTGGGNKTCEEKGKRLLWGKAGAGGENKPPRRV